MLAAGIRLLTYKHRMYGVLRRITGEFSQQTLLTSTPLRCNIYFQQYFVRYFDLKLYAKKRYFFNMFYVFAVALTCFMFSLWSTTRKMLFCLAQDRAPQQDATSLICDYDMLIRMAREAYAFHYCCSKVECTIRDVIFQKKVGA